MAKNDYDNFLDGFGLGVQILGAIAVAGSQIHSALSQHRQEEDEEAIAPQPQPKKQLPARRRKSNG